MDTDGENSHLIGAFSADEKDDFRTQRTEGSCSEFPASREEVVSELLAAFFVTYIPLAGIWTSGIVTDDAITVDRLLYVALCYGLSYGAIMYTFSFDVPERASRSSLPSCSVRHVNPIITLSLLLMRETTLPRALLFWGLQAAATLLACFCVPMTVPGNLKPYELLEDTHTMQSFFMSVVVCFLFVVIVTATSFGGDEEVNVSQAVSADDTSEQQPQTVHELNCIVVAVVVTAGTAVGSTISGGFMNPFFAIAVGYFSSHWLLSPLLAPLLSVVLAVFVRKLFRSAHIRDGWGW
eukprot:CAMPEP_0175139182 /NCGR_PEP_ID=MMETSP0087-20121206/10759_1 /TAXON_ID=136419 /ORGANISM="Unknown Unknown, Strain D1" /LENGTH=293 /DNA_ID=CAMNT_0016422161 /DNA_START=29 /DNA_END=907 /DNA_ORIENTATION=+